jgi:hypothetical protein
LPALIDYHQQDIQNYSDPQARKQMADWLSEWRKQLQPAYFPMSVLNELVDDLLIRKGIEEEKKRGVIPDTFDLKKEIEVLSNWIHDLPTVQYNILLTGKRLTDEDIGAAFEIIARREVFSAYLQSQERLPSIDEWLKKHKKSATIEYRVGGAKDDKQRSSQLMGLLQEQYE